MVIYLDIIFSIKTHEEQKIHLLKTFITLLRHQLVAKASKCEFFRTEILFLGHIITANGIKPSPSKVIVIIKMLSKNVIKLHTFLGMIAYMCNFITRCGKLISPLTKILDSKISFHWNPLSIAKFSGS